MNHTLPKADSLGYILGEISGL